MRWILVLCMLALPGCVWFDHCTFTGVEKSATSRPAPDETRFEWRLDP